jgi:hypothetical protein
MWLNSVKVQPHREVPRNHNGIRNAEGTFQLNPSWEDSSSSADEEFPNILWNRKVNYLVYESAIGSYAEPD